MVKFIISLLFIFSFSNLLAQDSLKVIYYNLLDFPSADPLNRQDSLKIVLDYAQPDVLFICELNNETGADLILNNVLNATGSYYERAAFVSNQSNGFTGLQNMVFYRKDRLKPVSFNLILTDLRDINHYEFFYSDEFLHQHQDTIFLDFYVAHLKASNDIDDRARRKLGIDFFRNQIDSEVENRYRILGGDFNFYDDLEPALLSIIDSGVYQFQNPLDEIGHWHNETIYSHLHTQSTRDFSLGGGASGGLDDRFDFVFLSDNIMEPNNDYDKVEYMAGSYQTLGNNGDQFNDPVVMTSLTQYPDALLSTSMHTSDHLAVSLVLQLNSPDGTSLDQPKLDLLKLVTIDEHKLTIIGARANELTFIRLLDLTGKLVFDDVFIANSASQTINFKPALAGSVYILIIQSESYSDNLKVCVN